MNELSKTQIKKLKDWCFEAKEKLLLNHWDISFIFEESNDLISVVHNTKYSRSSIYFSPKKVADEWKTEGEDVIRIHCFHELVHVSLARLSFAAQARWCTDSEWEEVEESTTTHLTKVILGYNRIGKH